MSTAQQAKQRRKQAVVNSLREGLLAFSLIVFKFTLLVVIRGRTIIPWWAIGIVWIIRITISSISSC
jgi:hypothetical protein